MKLCITLKSDLSLIDNELSIDSLCFFSSNGFFCNIVLDEHTSYESDGTTHLLTYDDLKVNGNKIKDEDFFKLVKTILRINDLDVSFDEEDDKIDFDREDILITLESITFENESNSYNVPSEIIYKCFCL